MPLLPPDDELLLDCYFSGTVLSFERSTMGAMLEMQESRYRDSEGRRVLPPEDRWLCITLHETRCEPSYEPDLDAILQLASLSRRLDAVARISPIAREAIEVYYGFPGQFWKRYSNASQEWALVGLTPTGAEFYQDRRARAQKLGTRCASSAAAELAAEVELQTLAPNAERQARLRAIAEEINRLLGLIVCTWQQTNGRSHAEK